MRLRRCCKGHEDLIAPSTQRIILSLAAYVLVKNLFWVRLCASRICAMPNAINARHFSTTLTVVNTHRPSGRHLSSSCILYWNPASSNQSRLHDSFSCHQQRKNPPNDDHHHQVRQAWTYHTNPGNPHNSLTRSCFPSAADIVRQGEKIRATHPHTRFSLSNAEITSTVARKEP